MTQREIQYRSVTVVPRNVRPGHRDPIPTTNTPRYPVSHPLDIDGSFLGVQCRRSVTPAILHLVPNSITRGVKPSFEKSARRRNYLRLCYLTFTADNHGLKKQQKKCWNATVAGYTSTSDSLIILREESQAWKENSTESVRLDSADNDLKCLVYFR